MKFFTIIFAVIAICCACAVAQETAPGSSTGASVGTGQCNCPLCIAECPPQLECEIACVRPIGDAVEAPGEPDWPEEVPSDGPETDTASDAPETDPASDPCVSVCQAKCCPPSECTPPICPPDDGGADGPAPVPDDEDEDGGPEAPGGAAPQPDDEDK